MNSIWKSVYPYIGEAVFNLDSVDLLLRQVTEAIAIAYGTTCWIWAGLERGAVPRTYRASADQGAVPSVEVNVMSQLPSWLLEQSAQPQMGQLDTGDLIAPVVHRTLEGNLARGGSVNALQLVIQLKRSEVLNFSDRTSDTEAMADDSDLLYSRLIRGWQKDELEAIEIISSQLGLAYSALFWRQWLEQSRHQAALVGRIAHLLNSSLNPDEIVERIVAELGQGFGCDRCILVNLRDDPAAVMAVWDYPDRSLLPLERRQLERSTWQVVIESFLEEGASYLRIAHSEPELEPFHSCLQELGAASALLIPLFVQAEFLGAVCLLSYEIEQHYSLDELQTVRQVADHAAIALTNAQNYQSLWNRKEALQLQNRTLQQEIGRDELTHLMNRRALERQLAHLSSLTRWNSQQPFSIILCDIDYFKLVNDTYGHLVGDEVLQRLAHRLTQQLRRETPAYRYGGEEFVVILPDTDLDKAVSVAERLRYSIRSTPIKTASGAVEITASFGVAQQDLRQDSSAWEVFDRSDKALYEAKRQGRDCVKVL